MDNNNLVDFGTGATRDAEDAKPDYAGFLHPIVIRRFGVYMHQNRFLKDGSVRESDNWTGGMSRRRYVRSLWRHFMDVWLLVLGFQAHDHVTGEPIMLEDALCALFFNSQGLLLEVLLDRNIPDRAE